MFVPNAILLERRSGILAERSHVVPRDIVVPPNAMAAMLKRVAGRAGRPCSMVQKVCSVLRRQVLSAAKRARYLYGCSVLAVIALLRPGAVFVGT